MRPALTLLLPAAILFVPIDAASSEGAAGTESQAIIHGVDIDSDRWPSACAILISADVTGLGFVRQPQCTCTLIAPDVVLTAAHCLDTYSLTFGFLTAENVTFHITFAADLGEQYEALIAGQEVELPDDAREAKAWVAHEDFDIQDMQNVDGPGQYDDIGLLFFDEVITDRPFTYLPDEAEAEAIIEGLEVVAVGYGQQNVGSGNPMEPPDPDAIGDRQEAETFVNEVGDWEMQIGDEEDSPRKCHGDSGGPSYAEIGQRGGDAHRVIGVTSHAYDERRCQVGGVDTRVDAYLDWIDARMREACEAGDRADCAEPGIPEPEAADAGDDDDDDGGGGAGAGCDQGCGGGAAVLLWGSPVVGRRRTRRT